MNSVFLVLMYYSVTSVSDVTASVTDEWASSSGGITMTGGKPRYSEEKKLSLCHPAHQTFHKDCPRIETGPPQ